MLKRKVGSKALLSSVIQLETKCFHLKHVWWKLAFYSGNNLTPDYGDKLIILGYKIIWRRRNNKVHEDLITKLSAIQQKNKAERRGKTKGTVGHHILTGIDGTTISTVSSFITNQGNFFCITSSSSVQLTWN